MRSRPWWAGIVDVRTRVVNDQPGAVLRDRDGHVVAVMVLDVLDGRVQTIRAVVDPDRLAHVGPSPTRGVCASRFRPGDARGGTRRDPSGSGQSGRPSPRAMSRRWTSEVPSPIVRIRASW